MEKSQREKGLENMCISMLFKLYNLSEALELLQRQTSDAVKKYEFDMNFMGVDFLSRLDLLFSKNDLL